MPNGRTIVLLVLILLYGWIAKKGQPTVCVMLFYNGNTLVLNKVLNTCWYDSAVKLNQTNEKSRNLKQWKLTLMN